MMNSEKTLYLTVSCDWQPGGISVVGWFSTAPDFLQGGREYPFYYHQRKGDQEYHIHSNCELTIKLALAIAEHVQGSVNKTVEKDKKRKIANR